MNIEFWSHDRQEWQPSRMTWTAEQMAEMNSLIGWEMYREAE